MNSQPPEPPRGDWINVGNNLRRLKTSGVYYVFAKRKGNQFRRSLHTKDKAQARRLKDDFMRELDRLASAEAAQITFEQLAARWNEAERHTLKESTAARRAACVKAIAPAFFGLQIRHITARHCEAWANARANSGVAAATFVKELETMRGAFRYATAQGLILHDPSANIKRPKIRNKPPAVPTREQFAAIVGAIRADVQGKGDNGALLVELLAYSGMRLNEARSLRWRDVNFAQRLFTVTGGERGTKNYEQRTVPLSDEMRALLARLKCERGKAAPDAFIVQTTSARKCLETACRKLGLPNFTHHSKRHFFATCAIESGVDIPTVARWLGHKDGGALLMKTYSHLQQAHSLEQMKRVSFGTL
jgi:integrase